MCRRPRFAGWFFDCCYLKELDDIPSSFDWVQVVFGNSYSLAYWDILFNNPLACRNWKRKSSSSEWHWTPAHFIGSLRPNFPSPTAWKIMFVILKWRVSHDNFLGGYPMISFGQSHFKHLWIYIMNIFMNIYMIYVGSKAVRCTTGSMWIHVDPCPEGANCDHPSNGRERGGQLWHKTPHKTRQKIRHVSDVSDVSEFLALVSLNDQANLDLQRIYSS